MQRCPTCNRIYSDPTQVYCLEDGSILQKDEPLPTIKIDGPHVVNKREVWTPVVPVAPQQESGERPTRWAIYALLLLVFVVLCGGVVFLAVFGYSHLTSSSAKSSQQVEKPQPLMKSLPQSSSPYPTPTPTSQSLVGMWRTNVNENKTNTVITVTFRPNGTTRYVFRSRGGTQSYGGTWQYSDETLFEKYPGGVSGKCSIKWIDQDTFELTIIDNGVPAYAGLKRLYKRLGSP